MIAIMLAGWCAAAIATLLSHRHAARQRERVDWACHELRGPLSVIGLGIELASRSGGLSPARLRAIELELGRAVQALDDLGVSSRRFDARARAGAAGEPMHEVSVGTLLAESIEAWRAAAGERELSLELSGGPAMAVHGHRLRLAQATGNLIANAIEHGDGPIVVRARSDDCTVRIEVSDSGRGLEAPLAEIVSRRRPLWAQHGSSRSLGRGHGLRIVAAVARAHGGRLVSAPSERGARLIVELPLAAESWHCRS